MKGCKPDGDVCLEHCLPLRNARVCADGCGHPRVYREVVRDSVMVGERIRVMTRARCGVCETWLPLGPSDEHASVRVEIEIRAAEIAAEYTHNLDECGPELPQCDDGPFEEHCVRCGWEGWASHGAEPDGNWHSGYLANCIATNEEP
jgi:hypothetical protein